MSEINKVTHNDSIDDLLEFAMDKEQESMDFYTALAGRSERPAMCSVFEGLAREEEGHKAKIAHIKATGRLVKTIGNVPDLKIADYLVEIELKPDLAYNEALVISMKREEAAHNLYTDLASLTDDQDVRNLMLELAQEEARHKLRFETEYDECALTEM